MATESIKVAVLCHGIHGHPTNLSVLHQELEKIGFLVLVSDVAPFFVINYYCSYVIFLMMCINAKLYRIMLSI